MKRRFSFIVLILQIIAISVLHAIKSNHPANENREVGSVVNSGTWKFQAGQLADASTINARLEK